MSTLTSLAEKYGCDKLHSHSYIPFYEELFTGMNVRRLLEIGIGYEELMTPFVPHYVHGASLLMWEEYFPEADIFACDIRPETLVNGGRIKSVVCDQSDSVSLVSMMNTFGAFSDPFDVIIDDGSHQTEHQVHTCQLLRWHLSRKGVYVIEDVQEPEKVARLVGGKVHRFGKRPDDNLVVVGR